MDFENPPQSEEELYSMLKKMKPRDYVRKFSVDRDYSLQLNAFGRRHPEFLVNTLLDLVGAEYSTILQKIEMFLEALDSLSEDQELRIKLAHKSLDKTL